MQARQLNYLVTFIVCISLESASDVNPSVTVTQGKLSGSWMKTRGGRTVAAFRGVPYAAPPIGDLRFKSPMPAKTWTGTKEATDDGNSCIQDHPFFGIYGEEDCLFLNIYSPDITPSKRMPVVVFIHGGAFKVGSSQSTLYGPEYLLDEDIVLVAMNYRLGIFGFMTFEDKTLPGNLGLKDQRAALRWIRDNIAQFGGDPNQVTLFGESAGAASVHYHMLFNSDEGLFRAGILHSGSAFTGGTFQRPGDQKPFVTRLLNQTGCQFEDSSAVIDCLQKIQPYRLVRKAVTSSPSIESMMRNVELSPVLEPECVEDAFVTDLPWNKSSSFPMIIGTNQHESLFVIPDLLKDEKNELFQKLDENFERITPNNLMFETSAKDPVAVTKELRKFYLPNNRFDREHLLQLSNLLSDGIWNYGTAEAVKNNLNKTYLYSFNYNGTQSFLNVYGLENKFGPTHADELFIFFPFLRNVLGNKSSTEDVLISKQLIKIWTNFVSHLQPTLGESEVKWEPVSTADLEFLNIKGPDNFTMDTNFYKERMNFWANLPFKNKPITGSLSCEE